MGAHKSKASMARKHALEAKLEGLVEAALDVKVQVKISFRSKGSRQVHCFRKCCSEANVGEIIAGLLAEDYRRSWKTPRPSGSQNRQPVIKQCCRCQSSFARSSFAGRQWSRAEPSCLVCCAAAELESRTQAAARRPRLSQGEFVPPKPRPDLVAILATRHHELTQMYGGHGYAMMVTSAPFTEAAAQYGMNEEAQGRFICSTRARWENYTPANATKRKSGRPPGKAAGKKRSSQ